MLICFCTVVVSAETAEQPSQEQTALTETSVNEALDSTSDTKIEDNNTAIPAIEQITTFFFDGKVTVSQIVEYGAIAAAAIFSFLYNKFKHKVILKDKAIETTTSDIERLKASEENLSAQVSLLGNIIVCAYLSNNLIDPELKKRLSAYADEMMKSTNVNFDKLTEKIISAAQNPDYKEALTSIKEGIEKTATLAQDKIEEVSEDAALLIETLTQEVLTPEHVTEAQDVIDHLKIEE